MLATTSKVNKSFSFLVDPEIPVKAAIELERDKQMQENLLCMSQMLAKFGEVEKRYDPNNKEKFDEYARSLVYDGVQKGTTSKGRNTDCQVQRVEDDPTYEPNPEEMSTTDAELDAHEEQRNGGNTSA